MKKFPENSEISDITYGGIIPKDKFSSLLVFPNLQNPYDQSEFILVIYSISKKLTRITSYPIENRGSIWKLKIIFSDINDSTMNSIANIIKKYKIIHTTGISKTENRYRVENYLYTTEDWENSQKIIEDLNEIEECSDFEINLLYEL